MKLTSEHLERAIVFATEKHKGQVRKGDGRPYVLHPMSVLIILAKLKKSTNFFLIAIACILHDVVEDCDVSLEEIARLFGHQVASLVGELTSDKEAIKVQGKRQYLAIKMVYMSSYALRIKLADRLDNLEDLDFVKDQQKIEETTYILKALKNRKLTKTHKKLIKLIEKRLNGKIPSF
jgi:(p)ppGpp synthase/HD superfamily hydrolase